MSLQDGLGIHGIVDYPKARTVTVVDKDQTIGSESEADMLGIWLNHQELYPIPDGFEDTTYHNDAAPSYTGLNGRCMVWMHDEATQMDTWGDATHRPLFMVAYHPTDEVYGLGDDEVTSMHLNAWGHVLQLLAIIKASELEA